MVGERKRWRGEGCQGKELEELKLPLYVREKWWRTGHCGGGWGGGEEIEGGGSQG